jgi:hypothetical protein
VVKPNGDVVWTDNTSQTVRMYSPSTDQISTLVGTDGAPGFAGERRRRILLQTLAALWHGRLRCLHCADLLKTMRPPSARAMVALAAEGACCSCMWCLCPC